MLLNMSQHTWLDSAGNGVTGRLGCVGGLLNDTLLGLWLDRAGDLVAGGLSQSVGHID